MDSHFNVVAEVVMDGSLGSDGDVSGNDHGGGRHGHRREGYIGVGGRRGWIQIKLHDNMLPLENTLKITKVIFIILDIYHYNPLKITLI